MDTKISEFFESGFLSESLARQMAQCDRYELAPLFLDCFRDRQPVLEAGCGSGRWCGWLGKHGIQCHGIDWSQRLCARAAREIPGPKFISADLRQIPMADSTCGGILALGSVEHSAEGPLPILREFHRLLRPGGIAVITVPFGSRFRLWLRRLSRPALFLRSSPLVRKLFGKTADAVPLFQAKKSANPQWHPRFGHGPDGWFFYEYEFNKPQMRAFLAEAGFQIQEEFAAFGNEGILGSLGPLAGKWDPERADVDLTWPGKRLRALIPVQVMGHMLCYVVEKETQPINGCARP